MILGVTGPGCPAPSKFSAESVLLPSTREISRVNVPEDVQMVLPANWPLREISTRSPSPHVPLTVIMLVPVLLSSLGEVIVAPTAGAGPFTTSDSVESAAWLVSPTEATVTVPIMSKNARAG